MSYPTDEPNPTDAGALIQAYVPGWVAKLVAPDEASLESWRADTFPAAVLLADVSGFTALGERLTRLGPEGAEKLWRVVNAFFGETLDLIQEHGGDVLRFAGDAPVVI